MTSCRGGASSCGPGPGHRGHEQAGDLDAFLAAYWCALHLSAAGLAELLAGDDRPGEGCLATAGRLTAARLQAREIISGEHGPPVPEDEDAGDDYDEPIPDTGRPLVRAATTGPGRRSMPGSGSGSVLRR